MENLRRWILTCGKSMGTMAAAMDALIEEFVKQIQNERLADTIYKKIVFKKCFGVE